jgi:hypothetical protein
MNITLTINGKPYSHDVEPRLLLIHYLREIAGLTGPHIGCETSLCGACTVELNGKAVKSCSMFAVQADGAKITTIEGWPWTARNITPCRKPSGTSTGCNAASARRDDHGVETDSGSQPESERRRNPARPRRQSRAAALAISTS